MAETANNGPAMTGALLGLHALTSLHPGSGTALGTVDLPVQRERHTQWPTIPGSALKGVLRDACRENISIAEGIDRKTADKRSHTLRAVFGPDTETAAEFAGAVSLTDARLLAFPVRSLAGVFAHVTCPAVLRRLRRDLEMLRQGVSWSEPRIDRPDQAVVAGPRSPCLVDGKSLVLEEFLLEMAEGSCRDQADWLANHVLPSTPAHNSTREHFCSNLVVLSDEQFTHFVRYATEVTARIRLDPDTKTVADGALFYEEFLPPETLFYSVALARDTSAGLSPALRGTDVVQFIERNLPPVLQVGANQTTGKGFCFTRWTRLGG
ncbi:MAG: type III-B CRISPR module RAMP protein Cmr4 [Isosphaeraceae bacterium]